jgi:hypothetical protein
MFMLLYMRVTKINSFFFLLFLALTVRFLTKRYIGEYDHQAGKFI